MEIGIINDGTRLYVPVDIVSDDLGERVITINFLIDTGADVTTINALDALDNIIDSDVLEKSKQPSIGIGGKQSCEYIIKNVTLRFSLVNGKYVFATLGKIDVAVADEGADKDSDVFKIPSLLGTDVLKMLKLTYNSHSKLELKK